MYLVVAHRDSKSQPVPLSFRGPAIAFALLAWLALFVLALASIAQPVAPGLALAVGVIGVIAGLILLFCWVENNSPGALDNATGVVALLELAAREHAAGDVAFLVTDAEELGLAGARAIAGRLPVVIGAINLDGLDDEGAFWIIERFGWPRKRGLAPHLAAAMLRAADDLGLDARRRDVPFGIMLDHIPLVQGGTPAISVLRGGLRSLRRVHRPEDDLDHLRGDGIAPTIRLVARALELLRAQEPAAAGVR
jgi:Zn-dependent M28 family amino/carboxypeptidase